MSMPTAGMGGAELVAMALKRGAGKPGVPTLGRKGVGLLARVPLFAGLSRRHLRNIAGVAEEMRFGKDRTITREGTKGDAFYVIVEGKAKVLRGPTRKLVARLGPGDFFGELALLTGGARTATVIAETPLVTVRIARAAFRKMIRDQPDVGMKIMEGLAGMVRDWGRSLER